MAKMKTISLLLVLALALMLLPVQQVSAAETPSLWLHVTEQDGKSVVAVCTDATVATGMISIAYDAEVLRYKGLTTDKTYVLYHAVNDASKNEVLISWIAPADHVVEGPHILMTLNFNGVCEQPPVLTGQVFDAAGNEIAISALDTAPLQAALEDGAARKAEDYTAESFAALQTALEEANALLSQNLVTQDQLDEAAQKLQGAITALVAVAPVEPTQPTVPADPTNPTEPIPTPTPAPDNGWIVILVAFVAICVIGGVVAVVIMKKRGNK